MANTINPALRSVRGEKLNFPLLTVSVDLCYQLVIVCSLLLLLLVVDNFTKLKLMQCGDLLDSNMDGTLTSSQLQIGSHFKASRPICKLSK